jgi:hypothetical protein
MQPADLLRDGPAPRHRKRQKQSVQARIIEALSDGICQSPDDATLPRVDGCQPPRL